MKAKILYFTYDDSNKATLVMCYLEENWAQAEKDLKLLQEFASNDKSWYLVDVALFNGE